jgi:hypothetical protein
MKYYLIIGYQLLEKYREFPTVRAYINGELVDEFECDNEQTTKISAKFTTDIHFCAEHSENVLHNSTTHEFTATKKYKVIEVDSSLWPDEGNLVLEVLNNQSDYNNGFMNKRSLVSFGIVLLIRKDIHDSTSKMYRIIKKYHTAVKKHNINIKLAMAGGDPREFPRWPGVTEYLADGMMDMANYPRGGNFKKKFTIKKKHKMHMLLSEHVETKGYFFIDRFFLAWYQYYSKIYFKLTTIQHDIISTNNGPDKRTVSVEIKEINTSNED